MTELPDEGHFWAAAHAVEVLAWVSDVLEADAPRAMAQG
jgi:hypothetical protein